jgi:hypothetical protein
MGKDFTQVVITSDPGKLPPAVRAMVDKSKPLAPGVVFFEERFTVAGTARVLALGIVLAVIGLIIGLAGIIGVTSPGPGSYGVWIILTGFAFLYGGYWMFGSLRARWAVMRAQKAGEHSRYGIFVSDDLLINNSWFDTTVIPRSAYQGMQGQSLRYDLNGEAKSFALPGALVGAEHASLDDAISAWSKTSVDAAHWQAGAVKKAWMAGPSPARTRNCRAP